MNGARAIIRTLHTNGIDTVFSNPGTSEMHLVQALDHERGMRCVLGLFEGVATGAADGFARIRGRPAATLLHLGCGLANGLANIHNAHRGAVGMLNLVGDHATSHARFDAPLQSDIAGLARPMNDFVRRVEHADHAAGVTAAAIAAATTPPGRVATLIVPADVAWSRTSHGPQRTTPPLCPPVADAAIEGCAAVLDGRSRTMLLLGGVLDRATLDTAAAIAQRSGARLACETFVTRIDHGAGTPRIERLPYIPEFAIDTLKDVDHLVLAGASAPVAFFAYPGLPGSLLADTCHVHTLYAPEQDGAGALARLAATVDASTAVVDAYRDALPPLPTGALTGTTIAAAIAALLPQTAIIVDEGIVGGAEVFQATAGSRPHTWIQQTGGAIGWGMPAGLGAAIACPDRKVLVLEGDGSAMYTIQALWSMARESADVTTVIFANRAYAILQFEYARFAPEGMGASASAQMDLSNPAIDYVALAQSLGVAARRAETAAAFVDALQAAMATPGPHLIEAVI